MPDKFILIAQNISCYMTKMEMQINRNRLRKVGERKEDEKDFRNSYRKQPRRLDTLTSFRSDSCVECVQAVFTNPTGSDLTFEVYTPGCQPTNDGFGGMELHVWDLSGDG